MKKEYTNPIIEIISLSDEDIITTSSVFGGTQPGDTEVDGDAIL